MDNLRKVTNSANIESLIKSKRRHKIGSEIRQDIEKAIQSLSNTQTDFTNYYRPDSYHPHFIANKKAGKDAVLAAIESINKEKSGGEERVRKLKQLIHQYKNMTGEWLAQDLVDNEIYDQAMKEIEIGKKGEAYRALMSKGTTGNMMSRSTELPGWDRSLGAWDIYTKNLIETFHRQVGNILSRDILDKFTEKTRQNIQNGGWEILNRAELGLNILKTIYKELKGSHLRYPNIGQKVQKLN